MLNHVLVILKQRNSDTEIHLSTWIRKVILKTKKQTHCYSVWIYIYVTWVYKAMQDGDICSVIIT